MQRSDTAEPIIGDPHELAQIARLRRLAEIMDASFTLPGTKLGVGWDPFLSLVPGIGDAASALVSGYIVLRSARLGVPRWTLFRMLLNVFIDTAIGSVPLLGDLFDVGWKANLRNVELLERAMTRRRLAPRSTEETGKLFASLLVGAAALLIASCAVLVFFVVLALLRGLG